MTKQPLRHFSQLPPLFCQIGTGGTKTQRFAERLAKPAPLPAPHKTANPIPISTPGRVAGAIHARFDSLHDRFDKSFVTLSLLVYDHL
jgi:hypothetical protein